MINIIIRIDETGQWMCCGVVFESNIIRWWLLTELVYFKQMDIDFIGHVVIGFEPKGKFVLGSSFVVINADYFQHNPMDAIVLVESNLIILNCIIGWECVCRWQQKEADNELMAPIGTLSSWIIIYE